MKLWKKNIILVLAVILIGILPLYLKRGAEFEGADGQAKDLITEISPDYEPWLEPVLEPASGEIESLFFCIQAAAGAGVLGFVLGRITARPKKDSGAANVSD